MKRLFAELNGRRVFRVAAVYGAVAFVLLQAADLIVEPLRLPPWTMTLFVVLALLGFPVALVLAWAFEVTPEGVKRTEDRPGVRKEPDPSDAASTAAPPPAAARGRSRAAAYLGLGILVALVGFGAYTYMGQSGGAPTSARPPAAGDAPVDEAEPDSDPSLYPALLTGRDARSVAVLPFENLSSDTANAYFTAGIHDAVITALANVGDLTVTSRTSVMRYAGSAKVVRTIAAELGVTHIVEGTVQRAGGQVRATVQLIDAGTDRHVWADHFQHEVTPEAIFAIQSGIAEQVAEALEASLSPRERQQIDRRPTDNLEAWELYTRARHIARTSEPSPEGATRVFQMLRRSAALDPGFALAHAELAGSYVDEWERTGENRWRDSVQAAVNRAMEIDPSLPEAHIALAGYHHAVGDLEAERTETLRALELRPNSIQALAQLSRLEADAARLDRSLCLARRATEVEPTEAGGYGRLGAAYRDLGFFAQAETAFRTVLDRRPETDWPYLYLIDASLAQGERARALEYYRALRASGDSTADGLRAIASAEWNLGWADSAAAHFRRAGDGGAPNSMFDIRHAAALWQTGDRDRARQVLARVEAATGSRLESGAQGFFPHLHLMAIHAMRGETSAAVTALERAVERGFRILPWIQAGPGRPYGDLPGMERLGGDPRYRGLVARLSAAQDSMRQIVERNGC